MKIHWICGYFFIAASAHGAIYKRVEANGNIVFTDIPGHNTELVDLDPLATNVIQSISRPDTKGMIAPQQALKHYTIEITTPLDGATIRNNDGQIEIKGKISPQHSGKVELWLNETLVATNPTPRFKLNNIPRGEYSIRLHLKDNKGKLIALSVQKTVYLHRASVLNRAN